MNIPRTVTRAFSNPNLVLREVNRLYHRRFYTQNFNVSGIDILSEDWDTLVILDACRYDMFEELNTLPGNLEWRISRGSSTVEFLRGNFDQRVAEDVVYVTANPQLHRLSQIRNEIDLRLCNIVDIWKDGGWDEDLGTVLPSTTTERAIEAQKSHPNKRLIVHYIQPHYPFLQQSTRFDKGHLEEESPDEPNFWFKLMTGQIDVPTSRVWELYKKNLKNVFPHVRELLEEFDGKTVVTSDHGNMLNERSFPLPVREWGHPEGIHTNQLVKVPWLVYESGSRRAIEAGKTQEEYDAASDEIVSKRLKDLGYAE